MDANSNRGNFGEVHSLAEEVLYVPIAEEGKKPKIGMTFDSIQKAYDFYNEYAKEGGFSIRSNSSNINRKTGEQIGKQIVCNKEGHKKEKLVNIEDDSENKSKEEDVGASLPKVNFPNKRMHPIRRENCKAAIRLKKDSSGKWKIISFIEEHTHGMVTPRKVHLLRSHRQVKMVHRQLLNSFDEANIPTSKFVSFLEIEAGGPEKVGCTERDIRNVHAEDKKKKRLFDAQDLLDHFNELKEINDSFFYAYEVDENNKLLHCFWADGRGRKSYHHFNDVVVFDTTYDTNQYSTIFAPFTGVNQHFQSTT